MSRVRDGSWELIDYDFRTGRSMWATFDGEKTVYRLDYPVDATIDHNTAVRNHKAGERWGEGQRIASIPPNIYHEQLAEASLQDDHKYISRWLNDSDNAAWRTFEGRV